MGWSRLDLDDLHDDRVLGGLAAVVVFAIKGFGGSRRSTQTQTPDARTVLETRFAKAISLRRSSRIEGRRLEPWVN